MTDWLPATTQDFIHCVSCENLVDTEEEAMTYPDGNCPQCGNPWTGSEKQSTIIQVTAPKAISGGAG